MSFSNSIPDIPRGEGVRAWKDYAWFFRYAMQSSPKSAALFVVLCVTVPFVTGGLVFGTKGVVDALIVHDLTRAKWMFGLIVSTFFLRGALASIREYIQQVFRLTLDLRIRHDVILALRGIEPAIFEHPKFQTFYHAFNEERGNLLSMAQSGYWAVYRFLEMLGYMSVFALLPWWMGLVIIAMLVPVVYWQNRERHWSWRILSMESREGRRGLYYGSVLMDARWLQHRWVLGLHELFFKRWKGIIEHGLTLRLKQTTMRVVGNLLVDLASLIGVILGGGYLFLQATKGSSAGALPIFFPAYQQFSLSLSSILLELSWVRTRLASVQMTKALLQFPQRRDGTKRLPTRPLEIVFDHVSFAYPDQETPVIRDISLTFREGEYVALVGLNGAGKSTFLKLLAGIYEPTSGAITINGTPLREVRSDIWVKALAYMTQEVPRFDDTIKEWIRYGDPKTPWGKRGNDVLRVSGFQHILSELPRGIDTHIGRGYSAPEDDPIELSGGQRQLLMIAQTLYRQARICIFDEPTSAVDAEKEDAFFQALPAAVRGKLCLVVSHRFSVLRRAKRILVMDGGKVIEDGSHEELLANEGRYAELFALQAKMYQ